MDSRDLVRGPVPSPDQPLAPSFPATGRRNSYGSIPVAPAQTSPGSPGTTYFIRADVTYLRPDFSVALPVDNPGPWPKMQRYDFVVRTRSIKPWESTESSDSYPQRESVLRVLRTLSGQDYGDRAEDWRAGLRDDPRFAPTLRVAKQP
jgi:hypothetical protein